MGTVYCVAAKSDFDGVKPPLFRENATTKVTDNLTKKAALPE
jgi:hypothetical protein